MCEGLNNYIYNRFYGELFAIFVLKGIFRGLKSPQNHEFLTGIGSVLKDEHEYSRNRDSSDGIGSERERKNTISDDVNYRPDEIQDDL